MRYFARKHDDPRTVFPLVEIRDEEIAAIAKDNSRMLEIVGIPQYFTSSGIVWPAPAAGWEVVTEQ